MTPEGTRATPRGRIGRRPAGWALGLPALALITALACWRVGPAIEHDIRTALLRLPRATGDGTPTGSPLRTEADGRDVAVVADFPPDPDAQRRFEDRIQTIRGVRRVATLVVPPVVLDPFTFEIRHDGDLLVLGGGVPSGATRQRLVEDAGRLLAPERIEDRMRLATSAPPGFDRLASRLLRAIGAVPGATASLLGDTVSLRASPPDTDGYRAIRDVLASLPDGLRAGNIAIEPPVVSGWRWSARSSPSGVVLEGFVPSEAIRADLRDAAAASWPDLPLDDRTDTARGQPAGLDVSTAGRALLASLGRLRSGIGTLNGGGVSLLGQTVARAERDRIQAQIRADLARVTDRVSAEVEVVPASPFRLSLRRGDGEVVASGFLPGDGARTRMVQAVLRRFPGERLRDRTILADGAPDGFEAAEELALENLGEVAEGEVVLDDRDVALTGRVLYRQLADRLRTGAKAGWPPGWTVRVGVEGPPPEDALDAFACPDLLADAERRRPVGFAAGATALAPASAGALEGLAAILRRCGSLPVRVVHRLAPGDKPQEMRALANGRAEALAAALAARVAGAKLSAEGALLETRPAPDGLASGRPATERTEFEVTTP